MKKTLYVGAFVVISMSGSIYSSEKASEKAPAKGTYVTALASAQAKLREQGLGVTALLSRFEQRPTDQFGYPAPSSVGKTIERQWTQDVGGSKEALKAAMGSTTKIVVVAAESKSRVPEIRDPKINDPKGLLSSILGSKTTPELLAVPVRPKSPALAHMPKEYESTTVVHPASKKERDATTVINLADSDDLDIDALLSETSELAKPEPKEADVDIQSTTVIYSKTMEPADMVESLPKKIERPTGISRDVRGIPTECLTQIEHIYKKRS